ncbi:DHA1 family tetracycline resistance protein-like MFS transporter [Amorphus suaedae]
MVRAKLALVFVVFVDLLGQGLVFPIINALVMDPGQSLLPAGTSEGARQFSYGLVIGVFFLAWFLGAAYVAQLSDAIGRKKAMTICLFGALLGYALTLLALATGSLTLLVVGRAISGFTSGSQPIAQAAMADISTDDTERARNMGYVIAGVSAGLVAGPLIGGVLSDPAIIGPLASLSLPFYAAFACVAVAIAFVQVGYRDARTERKRWRFDPLEIVRMLTKLSRRPLVLRISLVYFVFLAMGNTVYVFVDTYLASRFAYGTFATSLAMLVLGAALAVSSTFCVAPLQVRFGKRVILAATTTVMIAGALLFALTPWPAVAFACVFVIFFCFGIAYPTLIGLYSASVPADEQGWVMGVSTALFTLGAGLVSLAGGELMELSIRAPFYAAAAMGLAVLLLIATAWRGPEVAHVLARPGGR